MKKVGEKTRTLRCDLNQIPYDYSVEVTSRFKEIDLIECLKNYGQRFVTLCRRQGSKPSPRKNNAKRKTGNINNHKYADDTTLMAEREVELKNLLKKVTEESEKAGLKLNIEKTKIMTSGPIPSWKVDGETKETVTDFLFLGSQTHC